MAADAPYVRVWHRHFTRVKSRAVAGVTLLLACQFIATRDDICSTFSVNELMEFQVARPTCLSSTRSNDIEPCRCHLILLLIAYVSDELQWHQVGNAIPIFLKGCLRTPTWKKEKETIPHLLSWHANLSAFQIFKKFVPLKLLVQMLLKCPYYLCFLYYSQKFLLSYIYFISVYKFYATSKEAIVIYEI